MTLTYNVPDTQSILTLVSYLFLLNIFDFAAQWLLSAGLLGQVLIGVIFGSPLGGWLQMDWEASFVDLGYIGLLVLVFEGGMSTHLSTLRSMLPLAVLVAITGLTIPIGLSFLLTPMFGFPLTHSFAAGSALSSTSMGTVLSVLNASSFDLRPTKLGTVLLGAAIFDDVVAFVLSSVLEIIGGSGELGASIGRTVGVTIGLALASLVVAKYLRLPSHKAPWLQSSIMILILLGMIAASGYAGTSILYGAYTAGLIVSHIQKEDEYSTAFHHHIAAPLKYILVPLFFGSIGCSIPFLSLWRGPIIWKGVVYTLFMTTAKGACGLWILVWPIRRIDETAPKGWKEKAKQKLEVTKRQAVESLPGALLIGMAMVSRGEIGLLISQIAYHTHSPLLTDDEFLVITWAIVLCTIIGPVGVGLIMKRWERKVIRGGWE